MEQLLDRSRITDAGRLADFLLRSIEAEPACTCALFGTARVPS
ncbi:hypothetical protein ACWGLF_46135 [Streptomyces puniciscabiei]